MSRERIMLTQAIPAVQQLRRVQGFDPLRFLKRNANGGVELEPRYQRLWFRLACPDGKMLLNRLQITDQIAVCKSFFSKVLKFLAFQGVWIFLCSQFPLFFPLSGKNKGKSYCTLSSSFAASRLASLLACA